MLVLVNVSFKLVKSDISNIKVEFSRLRKFLPNLTFLAFAWLVL